VAWIVLAAILSAALTVALADWSWQAAYQEATNCKPHRNVGNSDIECPFTFWRWATHDPTAVFTFLLCAISAALAYFTYGLFKKAADSVADAREAARKVRSFVRGAGQRIRDVKGSPTNYFQIEGRNAGDGTALIHRVQWGFAEFGKLTNKAGYTRDEVANEPLIGGAEHAVRHVEIPAGFKKPVIFFRFHYYDVNRKREAIIGQVMQIDSPDFPILPVPIRANVPDDFLIDTFPPDEK
jgi:hypothetical protein